MRIGVPKEIKNREHRVGITPDGVRRLESAGHEIIVETQAGFDCGFRDEVYEAAGARIVDHASMAWDAELVVKVKEPLPSEYALLHADLCLFTFLHLAAYPNLANELLKRNVCAVGYETVQTEEGALPLLAPMSRVAGRLASQMGAHYLQYENGSSHNGSGKLLGGIDGVAPGQVMIIGGGNAGTHAALAASGLGANVILFDNDIERVRVLQKGMPSNIVVSMLNVVELDSLLNVTDLLIGAALIPGDLAPKLLTQSMIGLMPSGSVFVDISIDQGGISETSRATTYELPVYVDQGVIHCCLPNLPASVPQTSTKALTSATLPYIEILANYGIGEAFKQCVDLARGINTWQGKLAHAGVARALGKGLA